MLCDELYNELCQLLTNFETGERPVDANDFLLPACKNTKQLGTRGPLPIHNKETLIIQLIRAYGLFVGTIFYRSRHSRLH